MRIAIVDDLAAERTLLKGRLEWQLQRRNVQADILEYESGEIFLEAARKGGGGHDSPSSFIFLRKSQIRLSRPPVIPDLFPIFTPEI